LAIRKLLYVNAFQIGIVVLGEWIFFARSPGDVEKWIRKCPNRHKGGRGESEISSAKLALLNKGVLPTLLFLKKAA